MKSESIKFTVGKFTGGKLLLALVGLMLLGVSTQAKAAHEPLTPTEDHPFTFTIGTAIGNVGLSGTGQTTDGNYVSLDSFSIGTADTKTDFSALADVGITFSPVTGTFTGTPTAGVDITYSIVGIFGDSVFLTAPFPMMVYVAPPAVQALSAAAQDPLTFTAGVESTFTLTQGMGGTPPYAYYVTDAGYSDIDTAFGQDRTAGTLFSLAGIAVSDSKDYLLTITDSSTPEQDVEVQFPIVVLAAAEAPVDTGLPFAVSQPDITFTVGVATTHTLNEPTGGVTPYEQYNLSKGGSSIRAAALVFDEATRELRSTTSIVASDAGRYTITARDNNFDSEAETRFQIVVLAPLAISFVATPTTQVAEGQVFAAYVGQTNVDVTLPDTDPKSGTAAGTVSGITQLMYMNGCRVTEGSRPDMRAFGTTGDPATTCAHTAFSSSASLWRFNGHHNDDVGTMDIAPLSGADVVQANWASGLKAVAFSYEVTYSGDVITRNFTYVFYNKPTIAAQTDVSWDGDATAFVATFSPGADGYRGGTFNGVFTIDGGALTYGVSLAQSGLNPAFTGGLVPGIGVDVIDINGVATPVLTATAYTASTPAYVATTYELTVGDLAGNTAVTSFTLAVTELVAPTFSAPQGPFTFTAGIAGTKTLTPAANAPSGHTLAKVGGNLAALSINTAGDLLTATSAIAAGDAGMYEITASDAANLMAKTTFAVVVVSAPTFPASANPGNQTVADGETNVSITLGNAIGGTPPVTYGLTAGAGASSVEVSDGGTIGGLVYTAAVPGGAAATISGTVSTIADDFPIVYTAVDAYGATTQFAFVFNPSGPSFGSPQGPFAFTAGYADTKVLTPASNASVHTLAKLSGSLAALSINTAGDMLIATSAIAAGDAGMYEITASDSSNNMAKTTFSVVVADELEFPASANPGNQTVADGETNVSITLGNAIGGTPQVTYGLTAGGTAVSDGGTIGGLVYAAASGGTAATISGTVSTIADDFMIVYTAGDANGATTQFAFVFNPSTPPVTVNFTQRSETFFFDDVTEGGVTTTQAIARTVTLSKATGTDALDYTLTDSNGVAVPSEVKEADGTLLIFDPATLELSNTTFAVTSFSGNYIFAAVDSTTEPPTHYIAAFAIAVAEKPDITDETYAAVEAEFLPDVGAAVAAETVLAIGERVGQVRARGFGAPYVSIGEQSTLSGFISQHAKPLVDKQIEPKQLLKGAHLSLPLFSNGAFSWIPPMGIWLAIEGRAMSNETDEVKWDGTLGGAYLGIDARVGDSIVGVASATSKSTIDYEDLNPAVGADAIKGEYDLSLSSINPYISWQNGNSDWWITLGEGEGELTRNPDKVDEIKTDLVLKSVAFGVSRALNQQERRKTRLSASLQAARLEVEGKAGKNLLDPGFVAETYKGGLGKVAAEVDLTRALRGGSTLSPFYQAAALYDYGDNDNGVGMETVGGIRWLSTKRGSGGEMQVRWAAAGDYEEWGAYAQWRLQSGADGQGVSASLRPGYGDSDSADILQNGLPTSLIDGADYELHLDARVGFGLTGARGLVTPFAEWLHREDEVYRLGVDWLPSKLFEANLTGEQYTDEKRVWLKGEVKF